ncbi:MAG: hypothetical protein ACD_73C00263G0001 [uncultured bacterium]|nr:MAG: hypothetical protein ACD_73C00263G0001 [uncultured bacterium]
MKNKEKTSIALRIANRFFKTEFLSGSSRLLIIISLLGMGLGLATFMVSHSILEGFQETYTRSILGFNAHIIVVGDKERNTSLDIHSLVPAAWQDKISYSRFTFQEGVLMTPGAIGSILLKGVSSQDMEKVYPLHYSFIENKSMADLKRKNKNGVIPVLLGRKIFDDWIQRKKQSSMVNVIIPQDKTAYLNLKDLTKQFEVIGYFESGLYEFDSKFGLLDEALLKGLIVSGSSEGYEIRMQQPADSAVLAALMQSQAPSGVEIISWDELNAPLFDALKMEKTVFLIVMFFIVLIATLNIGGVILMILFKRKTDLQIFRFLGMSQKRVSTVLLLQSFAMAFLALIVGFVLSLLFTCLLNQLKIISLDPQIYSVENLDFGFSYKWFFIAGFGIFMIAALVSKKMVRIVLGNEIVLRERNE